MSDQPTALRLADALNALAERFSAGWHDGIKIDATDIVDNAEAAAELRRLHAEVEALRANAERDTDLLRQALWALESAPFMFPQCPQTIAALRKRLGDKP